MTPIEQKEFDQAEIKIRLIENGILIKVGPRWFTFESWEKASKHIADRLEVLKKTRLEAAR